MKIGIDLDGTITDFYSKLLLDGCKYGENNFNNKIIKNNQGFEIDEIFDWNIEQCNEFNEYVRTVTRMEISPRQEASNVLKKLHDKNFKIYIITSRKEKDLVNCKDNTKKWLSDNDIYYDELIIGNSNKLEECINNDIDIFIDDKIKHCQKCFEYGITTFLFDNPYNKNSNINRVRSFNELFDKISNIINEKKHNTQFIKI